MDNVGLIQSALVAACSLFWLWLGVMAFRYPKHLLRGFGIEAPVPDSWNEVRAIYGGFPLALAGLLMTAPFLPRLIDGIALTVGVATLGMCIGRCASAILDRSFGRMPRIFAAIEFAIAGILILPVLIKLS